MFPACTHERLGTCERSAVLILFAPAPSPRRVLWVDVSKHYKDSHVQCVIKSSCAGKFCITMAHNCIGVILLIVARQLQR